MRSFYCVQVHIPKVKHTAKNTQKCQVQSDSTADKNEFQKSTHPGAHSDSILSMFT